MRNLVLSAASIAVALAGCVSTQMNGLVGSPVQEALIRYGAPEQVIEMPDGRRAYQFRSEGGAAVLPGYATTTSIGAGATAMAYTTVTPGAVVSSRGCLLTFIAAERGGGWVIEDYRVPKGLTC